MVEIIHASYKSWSYPSFMTLSQSVNFERDLPESEEDKTLNSASLNDLRKIATDFSNQLRKAFDNLHLSQSNRNNTSRNFRKK